MRRIHLVGLLGILVLYGVYQSWHVTPACHEPDTAGYLALAERLFRGGPMTVPETDPFLGHSHVWVENAQGGVVPKYALGFPALMALAMVLGGEVAAFWVNPLCGGAILVGAFLLFRHWLRPSLALGAVAALALNPMFLLYTNYPLAHAVDLCAVTWGMAMLWRWRARPGVGTGLAAGFCLGLAAVTRPTSALLVLVVLLVAGEVLWRCRRAADAPPCGAGLVALLLAYAVLPLLHGWYNHSVFGSFWTTGYALSNEQGAFALKHFLDNAGWIFRGLSWYGLGLYGAFGVVGLFAHGSRSERLLRAAWFLPLFAIYAAYYWASPRFGAAYFRFFLPLWPVLIGAAIAWLAAVRGAGARDWVLPLCVGLAVMGSQAGEIRGVGRTTSHPGKQLQLATATVAAAHLQQGAAVFADSRAACRIGRGKEVRLYNLRAFDRGYARRAFQATPWSPRGQAKRQERFRAFYEENEERLDECFRERIQAAWEEGRQVALLVPVRQRRRLEPRLPAAAVLQVLQEWEVNAERRVWRGAGPTYEEYTEPWALYEVLAPVAETP